MRLHRAPTANQLNRSISESKKNSDTIPTFEHLNFQPSNFEVHLVLFQCAVSLFTFRPIHFVQCTVLNTARLVRGFTVTKCLAKFLEFFLNQVLKKGLNRVAVCLLGFDEILTKESLLN